MDTQRLARAAIIATGVGAVAVAGSGVAFAYWSSTGSGTGASGTGTPHPVVITAGSNPADLLPGGAGAVAVKLDNTVSGGNGNNFAVQLSKVNTVSVASSDETACPASNVTANQTLPYTLPSAISVGANTSVTTTIANLVKLSASAPDGCQGKTFTVTVTMS
jgi:hypothetical protein